MSCLTPWILNTNIPSSSKLHIFNLPNHLNLKIHFVSTDTWYTWARWCRLRHHLEDQTLYWDEIQKHKSVEQQRSWINKHYDLIFSNYIELNAELVTLNKSPIYQPNCLETDLNEISNMPCHTQIHHQSYTIPSLTETVE